MKQVWSIARLTFREGIRMRVVLVFLIVLVFLVLRMPFALRGDETLAGRLQNFLAYSLGALSLMLSVATVFFSCATLSNEFRDRSLHMVVTKPVSRFQILLGKWLGVNLLNLLILLLCGGAIYGLAYYVRTRPAEFVRDRYVVRDVVWTARAVATPAVPVEEITERAERRVREMRETGEIAPGQEHHALNEQVKEGIQRWRLVPAGYSTRFRFENLTPPETDDAIFQIRYKIIGQPLPPDEMLTVGFRFIDPETNMPLGMGEFKEQRSTNVHQFLVRAQPVIKDGVAILEVTNPMVDRGTGILFDGTRSLLLLYRVASFEQNYLHALLLIIMRLALLSALGVFFSVFVSFPVACLCTGSIYVMCLGLPFWLDSIGADITGSLPSIDPFGTWGPAIRSFLVPAVKFLFPNFGRFDGAEPLIQGEYISPVLIGQCFMHTVLYGGLILLGLGWLIFERREVAEVQV